MKSYSLIAIVCTSANLATAADPQPSGKAWVAKFPGSTKTADLDPVFQADVEAFLAAVKQAGATVRITSTLRPLERAYMMHWAWKISKDGADPADAPAMTGVDIRWVHATKEKSKAAAQEMVDGFGINGLKVAPALKSRHTEGKAIDAAVTWAGTLKVKGKDGKTVSIDTEPRDSTNAKLIEVGKGYGVIHFVDADKDRNHWSTDGR